MVTLTLELPDEIEGGLRRLARRTGRSVDQLILDAIDAMLTRELEPRSQPWPKTIGILSDGGVDATEFEDWLAENWTDPLE